LGGYKNSTVHVKDHYKWIQGIWNEILLKNPNYCSYERENNCHF